ncbi:hypothetical protein LRH25_31415 [Ideonella azotifigens]|uniref:Uncharacterized protein n=1 Tax=Ideonella azotifigens TaxID=513160 RepID=A0ABN1K007_9BURK|nr:hypothetical protein [Ideonella azotifigens]MCD2344834.1 hypothetical protein [Ideonella azotifigens]
MQSSPWAWSPLCPPARQRGERRWQRFASRPLGQPGPCGNTLPSTPFTLSLSKGRGFDKLSPNGMRMRVRVRVRVREREREREARLFPPSANRSP